MDRDALLVGLVAVAAFSSAWALAQALAQRSIDRVRREADIRVAELVTQLEATRQTGLALDARAVKDATAPVVPLRVQHPQQAPADAEVDAAERERIVQTGVEQILSDAKARGVPMKREEARRQALDMLAEAGL